MTSGIDDTVTKETDISRERFSRLMVHHRLPVVVFSHAVLFTLALLAAFLLAYNFKWARRDGVEYPWLVSLFLPILAVALPIKLAVFHFLQQYRGAWRYVGLRDLFGVISASLIGSFLFLFVYFVIENIWAHPLIDRLSGPRLRQSSVFALDWAATIVFVSAARVLVRFYYEDIQPERVGNPRRALIVGAGDGGEAVLRELLRMRREHYICVGFLDDHEEALRGRIHGVEVIGRTSDIRSVCEAHEVQEVLIALREPSPKMIRGLVEQCEGTGVLFRTMPAVTDVISGRVQISRIRDVEIADLLGREPVQLDADRIELELKGQRIVVTGAGGSIGSEMCRQIAVYGPKRLILIEQAENALFEVDRELRRSFPELDILACVADICDSQRITSIFERELPSIVFHAAAHKHVPLMESNPGEAIKNNIGGTVSVAETAMATGVAKMVVISTDKAVNPTSTMGCTKRVAEMYVQSLSANAALTSAENSMQFITVRFGNVLGSSGSVVPIFKEQIAAGGPVTVTHPDMVRFFMTIPEAAQLVLQAGAMGKGGEIYVLHMGDPVRIVDLARDMVTLSGLRPGIDIEIVFTGKRPGEKLYEELSTEGEDIGDTAHPKIGIWKHRIADPDTVRRGIARLIDVADKLSNGELQAELKRLVPEYNPDRRELSTGESQCESSTDSSTSLTHP
ncbi:MAG: polysaccharide biosynthesis protein [Planctomycetes bacterium]|nr:polysaccharide biosynthesis protein [Planctomycetota bacterium]